MRALVVHRLRADLDRDRAQPSRQPDPPLSDEEMQAERLRIRRDLNLTRSVVKAALAVPCSDHEVAAGAPCWSTGTAVCMNRLTVGMPRWFAVHDLAVGELEELAAATRRAHRAARLRAQRGWGNK